MTVLVSGAGGFVGSALGGALRNAGIATRALGRPPFAPAELAGATAVVHLAGRPVTCRWTDANRRAIRDSRVLGTGALAQALAALPSPPRVLVAASAIGIYGERGDEQLDERSPRGQGFLADVCADWEAATGPAAAAGVRVVHLRLGIVLGRGGALARMLLPFRLGLGGPLGSGRQWTSWVALDDVVAAIRFALDRDDLRGPVNVTAPAPVTNREFARALGKALHRPAVLPAPAFVLRALYGGFADEALLASQRVLPRALLGAGFAFRHPDLASALDALLHRPRG